MALKILFGVVAAIVGFITVAVVKPFGGGFDYANATTEEKQKFLDARARNFERGYRLAAGGASEITSRFADAEFDLISFSITLKNVGDRPVNASSVEKFRNTFLRMNCRLVERELLTDSAYTMRMRYFRTNGAKLFQVDVNGATCAPYLT